MFYKEVKTILEDRKWRAKKTPHGLLDMWEGFVKSCEAGYSMGIYEYDNDLSVRNVIELVLQNDTLKNYAEYKNFIQNVFIIDSKFKKLLSNEFFRSEKEHWWNRGVLLEAEEEYIEDIKEIYGFNVKNINS